jgi:hypothetical protein
MKLPVLKLASIAVGLLCLLAFHSVSAFYDPTVQRWINRDPLQEQPDTLHLYRFCDNAPTLLVDLVGLCPTGYMPQGSVWTRTAYTLLRSDTYHNYFTNWLEVRCVEGVHQCRECVAIVGCYDDIASSITFAEWTICVNASNRGVPSVIYESTGRTYEKTDPNGLIVRIHDCGSRFHEQCREWHPCHQSTPWPTPPFPKDLLW